LNATEFLSVNTLPKQASECGMFVWPNGTATGFSQNTSVLPRATIPPVRLNIHSFIHHQREVFSATKVIFK